MQIAAIETGGWMGKRGRKAKTGTREPNGRLKRMSTIEALNAMARSRRLAEQSVVLAQPHRRGSEDKRCASPLGRMAIRAGLHEALLDAAEDYAGLVRRYRAAWSAPRDVGTPGESYGTPAGPSMQAVLRMRGEIVAIERAAKRTPSGSRGFGAVKRMVFDHEDVSPRQDRDVLDALIAMAVQMGRWQAGTHPFQR